jgi:recombination protein RecT
MTDQTAALTRVNEYFNNDIVRARMADILGQQNAGPYIASVLLVVANNTKLQECSSGSIYSAAMQAATMRLSVDPTAGHAYIIPRKGRAVFQVGYRGLYFMAMRTGKYRYINVGKVYEGEEVEEDRLTGLHKITGQKTTNRRIGWIGAFEMVNGFAHTVYWTVEEVHAHARRYSQAYDRDDSPWRTETEKMERKTVLANMLKQWGYLDPTDRAALASIEEEQAERQLGRDDDIEGEIVQPELTREQAEQREAETMRQLGFS